VRRHHEARGHVASTAGRVDRSISRRRDGGSTREVHQFEHMRRFRTGNPVWHRRRNAASGRRVDCSTVSFFELALNVENDVLRGRRSSQSMGIVRSCLVLFPADDRTPIEVATV
jgi:hypothetical protein